MGVIWGAARIVYRIADAGRRWRRRHVPGRGHDHLAIHECHLRAAFGSGCCRTRPASRGHRDVITVSAAVPKPHPISRAPWSSCTLLRRNPW